LATADDRAGALSAQVRQLKEDTDRLFDELQTIQGRATAGENKAEAAARALLQAETLLKKAEAEIAERERKLREYRTAFEDAAKENTRLNQESARMSAQLLAGEAARKQTEVEKTRLQEVIKSLETTEGVAREELISIRARLRVREAELEASSTAKQALESELQAVSASHARLEVELAATKPSPPVTPDLFPVLDKTTESVPAPVAMVPREVSIEPPVVTAPVETENQIPEYTVDCPQRLGEVSGVTSQMVSRLYAAGIGSFWQLARADHDRLSGILETDLGELTLFNFDLICADAERKARETSSIGRKWSGESPDDLTMLDGLSVSHQRQLNDAGICTFAGLGKADPNDLAKICKPGAGRAINYNVWIDQACLLAGSDSV
jgi:predicted flap endonuclease-1-like 5' DNA nuclease/predicted  nucleic acid-binding Zn-ribbon protein